MRDLMASTLTAPRFRALLIGAFASDPGLNFGLEPYETSDAVFHGATLLNAQNLPGIGDPVRFAELRGTRYHARELRQGAEQPALELLAHQIDRFVTVHRIPPPVPRPAGVRGLTPSFT